MKNEGNKFKKSYIALIFILLVVLIGIFFLLENAKSAKKSKPLKQETTTTLKVTTTTASIVEKDDSEQINSKNFNASLEEIINGYTFNYDYKVTLMYNGAKFDFNCTNYDEENLKCLSGSALMNINNVLIPLFTYDEGDINYLDYQTDYYVMNLDKYIILATNYINSKPGSMKVYKKDGSFIKEIDNNLMSYKINGKIATRLYPSINEEKIYYYTCDNNTVKIASLNYNTLSDYKIEETMVEETCY